MRHRFLLFCLLAAVAVSCVKERQEPIRTMADAPEFFATIEEVGDPGTRVYVDDQLHVLWNKDDVISVFNKSTVHGKYLFQGEDGDRSGSFGPDSYAPGTSQPLGHVYAVYPYGESNAISESGAITLQLPADQSYRENSFGPGANTMIAVSESEALLFKNLCGYVAVCLYGDDVTVTSISLKGNNGEPLAGKVTVTAQPDAAPTLQFDAEGSTRDLTLTFDAPVTLGTTAESATTFWFVVPPTVFEQGFTIQVKDNNNGFFEKSTSGPLEVKRNVLKTSLPLQVTPEPDEAWIKEVLMKIYQAWDGPNWVHNDGWGTDRPIREWANVTYYPSSGELQLSFNGNGLKGEMPECIGELEGLLTGLVLFNEPGVEGTLPDSFRKLVNLRILTLFRTSMTSLPDVFADMKSFTVASITMNEKMTGPLPESIGSSPVMERLALVSDMFTGNIPASWGRLCGKFMVGENCLTGKLPDTILATQDHLWLQTEVLNQREGYGFDISELQLRGGRYWPEGMVEDIAGGASFSFEDVIRNNKCTVFLCWSLGDPFSKPLMNDLKELYDQYHQEGLDIIATVMGSKEDINLEEQKDAILKRGYDRWYNYYYPSHSDGTFLTSAPNAEVYDSNGNILFSSFSDFPDPVQNRFGRIASYDLVPFLLSIFEKEPYTSTDYSKDGEVTTLQTATVGNGINIVFMGDAFTDRDMGKDGFYETTMAQSMEEFFTIEPYKTFRDRFNVYAVKVVSPNGRVGSGYTTALETEIGDGTLVVGNADKAEVYSLKVPSISSTENLLTCVMVKNQKYAGTCLMSRTAQSAVAFTTMEGYDSASYGNVLRHEAGGHGFGFLSDEYHYYAETIPAVKKEEYMSLYERCGWYSNVDFTNDPAKVHWSAFLSDERYKDEVGIFEGGALYNFGVWRPSKDSMMYENAEYFNAPSRWAIYQRIMKLSGEEYSFEKFLEYDAVNRGKSAAAAAARPPLKAAEAAPRRFVPTAPPIIVP